MNRKPLPVPPHFNPDIVGDLRFVKYGELDRIASEWRRKHKVKAAAMDAIRICAMPIDAQITFAFPESELPVIGALDDANRNAIWIYENLDVITGIAPSYDTHPPHAIYHSSFWIDQNGNHPTPGTIILAADQRSGKWRVNPAITYTVTGQKDGYVWLTKYALHYSETLEKCDKNALIIWPYHAQLGGLGHALIPNLHEAIFFHSIVRGTNPDPQIKGGNPITENYSILGPEVTTDHEGVVRAQKNTRFISNVLNYDAVVISGQAKSHCVAWTIDDLLREIMAKDKALAKRVYLLEDCTSPVKIPDGKGGWMLDFTKQADDAFKRFADAGMNIVRSTTPIHEWPGLESLAA